MGNLDNEDIIIYECSEVYDGFCMYYDPSDNSINWRNHWAINRLPQEQKDRLYESFKNHLVKLGKYDD